MIRNKIQFNLQNHKDTTLLCNSIIKRIIQFLLDNIKNYNINIEICGDDLTKNYGINIFDEFIDNNLINIFN
jgi:hypothetical protein